MIKMIKTETKEIFIVVTSVKNKIFTIPDFIFKPVYQIYYLPMV